MVAHCQHYYWSNDRNYILELALSLSNNMLEIAVKKYDEVVVFNGLTQEYSGDYEDWHSWVPKGGWEYYIRSIMNIDCSVQPCMSYDSNLYFHSKVLADEAEKKLKLVTVNDQQLFHVESNSKNRKNIFVRLAYYGIGEVDIKFNKNIIGQLKDDFDLAAIRTGKHQQYSMAYGDIENEKKLVSNSNHNASIIY